MFSAGPGLQDVAGGDKACADGDTQQRQALGCFKRLLSHLQLPGLEKSRATRSWSREQEGLSLQHPKHCLLYLLTGPRWVEKNGKILHSAKFNHDNACGSSSGGSEAQTHPSKPWGRRGAQGHEVLTHTGLQPSQLLHFGIKEQPRWPPAASKIKRRTAKCSISRGKTSSGHRSWLRGDTGGPG